MMYFVILLVFGSDHHSTNKIKREIIEIKELKDGILGNMRWGGLVVVVVRICQRDGRSRNEYYYSKGNMKFHAKRNC